MPQAVIEQRRVGRSNLSIGRLGLGCVTFGREIDEPTSRQVLDYAVEKGVTFLDSAEAYGGGNAKAGRQKAYGIDDVREATTEMHSSEKILGRWLRDRKCRDRLVICTKVSSGTQPDNVRKCVGESLERLGIDCIDIYKLHSPNPQVPIAETLGALDEQVRKGRVKAIGGSNFNAAQLRECLDASVKHGYARFEITQPPYSLADRAIEAELLPLCRREQVAVSSYSPLAAGFLAGKYTPDRTKFPKGTRFDISPGHADVYFSDRNFRVVEHLRRKAAEMNMPMVRLAMAWVIANPDVTCVLFGARNTGQIDNALEALRMGISPQLYQEMSAWG